MSARPQHLPTRRLGDAPEIGGLVPGDAAATAVTGITLDSRSVQQGDIYAALPGGTTHGARFAAQAVAAGAAAIMTDPAGAALLGDAGVPTAVVADPRKVLGEVSAWVYGHPARDMTVIGVTGTNGKTTMTYLLAAALESAGTRAGVIGTIGIRIGEDALPSARTTPEAPDVHALLALMRERGVRAVAMEVSSHALVLGRVDGMVFDVAVFTNLTQDHLDFHPSMEDYFAAKADLFTSRRARRAVVCVDDEWGRSLANTTDLPVTTYAATAPAEWQLRDVVESGTGAWRGIAVGPREVEVPLESVLPGGFNRSNALGALAALSTAGLDVARAAAGLADCRGVPGRMEAVGTADYGAFVDYAHTPDAVERAIAAARGFCTGRVLVALGCGGDRDPGKRPLMGRVAAVGADLLIVTDDNPRSEDPATIRAQMLAGTRDPKARAEVREVADRAAAIEALVEQARAGDAVLVLGKGHESGQEVAGVVTPFDDREVLARTMQERKVAP